MSCANRLCIKGLMFAIALAALVVLAIPASAQENKADSSQSRGYVDDWSTHHVVFSNPGTEEDARRRGEHDRWQRIVNDPRYIMQQRRRHAPPHWGRIGDENSIQRDWSMSVGAQSVSTLTLTVSSAPASGTVSGSSTLTVDGVTFTGSAPTAEVETVEFSATTAPANTSSISIGGTEYEFVTSGSVATPASGCEVAAVDGATGATDLYDALTASGAQSDTTYECKSGATPNPAIKTSSTSVTARTVTVTSALAAFVTSTSGTTSLTLDVTTAGADGTDSTTGFKYVTSSATTYDQYDTEAQLANDLFTAINDNATVTGAVGPSYTAGATSVTLTNKTDTSDAISDASFTALSGTGTLAASSAVSTVQPNTYPAKYNFDYTTETASCSDYVVYSTGLAGSSSQATVIGYTNLYKTTCSGTVPTVAFAYNTGGTSALSPVLYGNGTQIAYIQVSSGVASLVLLRPSLTSGSSVVTPTLAASASAYYNGGTGCTAPCYYTITLNGSPNDTNSSPFYTYTSTGVRDIIYVGDNSGKVHKFNPVFEGAPAEITTNWPATASSETNPKLTSPIYDGGGSGLVFVGDATGYLHSISGGATPGTALTSNQMECGSYGFVDSPVVDPSAEYVFMFIGDGCSVENGSDTGYSSYVNVFAAGTSISASYGNSTEFGNEGTNDYGTVQYHGIFDNTYYEGTGTTGNLYTCVNGAVFQIPMSSFSPTGSQVLLDNAAFSTLATTVSDAATCSALTEYYNTGTSTDYLFLSLLANGSTVGSCTGSCIYNYNITSGGTTGSPSDALAVTGGTSAIIVDNSGTGTGESQVYFGSLSNETCVGNGTTGSGTGSCAVQASQAALQ